MCSRGDHLPSPSAQFASEAAAGGVLQDLNCVDDASVRAGRDDGIRHRRDTVHTLISVKEVCRRLTCGRSYLHKLRRERRLLPVETGGRMVRYRRADVDAFAAGLPPKAHAPSPQMARGKAARKSA